MTAERRGRRSWIADLRPFTPLAILWLAGALLLAGLLSQEAVPYEELLLDPAHYQGRPWYTGLISNLGVLGWSTATVAAAGGSWLGRLGGRVGAAEMLRGGALLSGLLLLDDLFQLHIVVPHTLDLPKVVFYGLYGGLAGWWFIGTRLELLRTRWPLLAAAVAALSASVAVDRLWSGTGGGLIAEDSAKFLGILAWALYFVMTARDITRSVLAELLTLPRPGPHSDLGPNPHQRSEPASEPALPGLRR